MSDHYCCKECGQRYDKCKCSFEEKWKQSKKHNEENFRETLKTRQTSSLEKEIVNSTSVGKLVEVLSQNLSIELQQLVSLKLREFFP